MADVLTKAYQIRLPQFEGPFDLLLFFIRRDELDIYDIPIHTITSDFLAFVQQMEDLNMEQASEFILFASTLMKIKSRMLLPRKSIDPDTGDEIDPRQELVDKILEYKRFKEVSATLQTLEEQRLPMLPRGNSAREMAEVGALMASGTEMQTISLYKLMKAYEKVLQRLHDKQNVPQHVIIKYNYSMEGQRTYLTELLKIRRRLDFAQLLETMESRMQALFTFLAILELVQLRYLNILTGTGKNSFILEWNEQEEEQVHQPEAYSFE